MIDKRITARKNFGGGADMGTVGTSTRAAGPGTGGYQGGPQGGMGDFGRPDGLTGADYERSKRQFIQSVNTAQAIEDAKKSKRLKNLLTTDKFGYKKTGLGGLIGSLLGFATGIPGIGLLTGLGSRIKDKLQDLRGYNPDGTPMTQEEYEQARRDRQIQTRIDNILDRQRLGKSFSQTNLDSLLGMTDMYGDRFTPSTAQNVLTGRDLKGFTDSRTGIISPEVIEGFANPIGPRPVNLPNTGILGIDVDLPGNNLMAGLTEKQKQLLDQRRGMLDALGDEAILDTIRSEDDPNDPATLQDVRQYYGLA